MRLKILYRGPLSSCNYDCDYCPFAKQTDSPEELSIDRDALLRFTDWVADNDSLSLSVFFTPWGEALTRRWYWEAFKKLTSFAHIEKVAIQTNLSAPLKWVDECDTSKVGVWATFHPSQTSMDRFLQQVQFLAERQISLSVGVVGVREDLPVIEQLRQKLPAPIYLWVNAFKRKGENYYTETEVQYLESIDPQFSTNNVYHPSFGRQCITGEEVISVDGDGTIYRCHFVKQPIGNLYTDSLRDVIRPRNCPNTSCGCHIGYIYMPHLELHQIYGPGMLERVPKLSYFSQVHSTSPTTQS